MRKSLLSVTLAAAFASTAAQAGITNGGFQTGNLTGWNPGGCENTLISVVTSPAPPAPSPDPAFFADLMAGCGTGVYTTLSQLVVLAAGDVVSGYAYFRSNDYLPYDDDGYVTIGGNLMFAASAGSTGCIDDGDLPCDTGWISFNFTAPSDGSYLIEGGVRNNFDNNVGSELYLDGFTVRPGEATVPEPGTMALFATSLVAFGLARRRKSA